MDIAALSMGLSQIKVTQQANTSVLKMAMDLSKIQAEDLLQVLNTNAKVMEHSVNPYLGANIDISL